MTRQSIFAGEAPLYFPDSLETTAKERTHWQRFWENEGLPRGTMELVTNLESAQDPELGSGLGNPRLAVLGIVWNKVDDIMHGMQMQTAGMHNQVRLWASQGHLNELLRRLADEGFAIYVTADHGNVTATGIGTPKEGVLVETKGKRVEGLRSARVAGGSRDEVPRCRYDGPGMGCPQRVMSCWRAT